MRVSGTDRAGPAARPNLGNKEGPVPRVDDYKAAFDIAARELQARDPEQVARAAGVELAEGSFSFDFVAQPVRVELGPVTVSGSGDKEISLTDQVLILHYLTTADGRPMSGQWIAFREIPGAQSYHTAFYNRAMKPLLAGFAENPGLLPQVAAFMSPQEGEGGDASIVVKAFPRVPLMLQVWAGDEDFGAEANVLFDRSVPGYMSSEDAAWIAGRVIYPLVGMVKAKETQK